MEGLDGITWLDPIQLRFETDEERLLGELRKQLRDAIVDSGSDPRLMDRCVYVVRMRGPVIVAYPLKDSPVLYVGRGNAPRRLASHLGNWLSNVHQFGVGVSVELRICIPRRKNRADFYKHVEADLILWSQRKNGAVPFFNSKREKKWESGVRYLPTQKKLLERSLAIGSGNKHQWAVRPLPANAGHDVYLKGVDSTVWD